MVAFRRLTLARQYMLVSLIVMLAGMIVIGFWISQQIETAVTNLVNTYLSEETFEIQVSGHVVWGKPMGV